MLAEDLNWKLSPSDEQVLVNAENNATSQASQLISNWQNMSFQPPIPPTVTGTYPCVNFITNAICKWSSTPNVTLQMIQTSRNVTALLNLAPNGASLIYPCLTLYLNALSVGISLQNEEMYTGAVIEALKDNVTSPSVDPSGGLVFPNIPGVYPAYTVKQGGMEVTNGLNKTSNALNISVQVTRDSVDSSSVSVEGGASLTVPGLDWFTGSFGGSGNYSYSQETAVNSKMTIQLTFSGVTPVNFEPEGFIYSSNYGWFDPSIIVQASNYNPNTTGFCFNTKPTINLGVNGDMGLATGMMISNAPSLQVTYEGSNSETIVQQWKAQENSSFSLFGLFTFGASSSQSNFQSSVKTSESGFTITWTPPDAAVVTPLLRTAFLIGVSVSWPYSSQATRLFGFLKKDGRIEEILGDHVEYGKFEKTFNCLYLGHKVGKGATETQPEYGGQLAQLYSFLNTVKFWKGQNGSLLLSGIDERHNTQVYHVAV